jgi:hypothetical protein
MIFDSDSDTDTDPDFSNFKLHPSNFSTYPCPSVINSLPFSVPFGVGPRLKVIINQQNQQLFH